MRMIFLINAGIDNSKAGTLPYDLVVFPFHSQKFNPKILTPKSQKHFHCYFNSRTYAQIHTPAVVQGGVLDMLQYFETILPLMDSL